MPALVLGPILRYVSDTEATVWVQTDIACEVEILGRKARTFAVGPRHYALVVLRDLQPGSSTEYEVALDGERQWPVPDSPFPPSRIQTLPDVGAVRILWGSCRVARPHGGSYALDKEQHPEGVGVDALHALVLRMREQPHDEWPALALLIGDQVYADEVSPQTLGRIRARRDTSREPGEEVLDIDEYTMLYEESWGDPSIRWLLSTVGSAMMFDDHDVHDDWNTSDAWVRDMRATSWWHERIVSALVTYWVYQHMGNLSPDELDADPLYRRVVSAEDAEPVLRQHAEDADRNEGGRLWSFSRRIGRTRLVVLDGREGRVLSGPHREMMDPDEWSWLERQLHGDHDHVLIAGTLPVLLAPTLHWVEAWNEAVCAGGWGQWARRPGESLRRALDLEHWAAFQDSFHRLIELVGATGSGARGTAPAAIVMLGGDVHQSYVERVSFPAEAGVTSAVYQAVCSPFRNQLAKRERRLLGIARRSRLARRLARRLALSAGVREPVIRWDVVEQPTWRNQLGWLRIDGRELELTIEGTPASHAPALAPTLQLRVV
ncbi:MAG TPA: alkaline phosphatase D family protein [Solirubrobacteraceae bacterium]|nr:alkaline phosphatase D family protein [Solirubrobacteraceae bacterium]